jgi:hypothetical protein
MASFGLSRFLFAAFGCAAKRSDAAVRERTGGRACGQRRERPSHERANEAKETGTAWLGLAQLGSAAFSGSAG